jgi:hypothetical protein
MRAYFKLFAALRGFSPLDLHSATPEHGKSTLSGYCRRIGGAVAKKRCRLSPKIFDFPAKIA